MTDLDEQATQRPLRWRREDGPARVYTAGEFQIIYDPPGPTEGLCGGFYLGKLLADPDGAAENRLLELYEALARQTTEKP
jgi:hypothetical protein